MATLAQMGIPGTPFGILHPKQKFRWRVTFTSLAALVPSVNGRDITRQLTNAGRPNISFSETAIHRYNSTAYLAGKYEWQDISLTIEDDITGLASIAVQGQLETQQRLIGADLPGAWLNAAATGSDYKFGMLTEQLDGNEGVVESWGFEGCWIKTANYGELDYNSNDAVTIALTIRFDMAHQLLSGAGYGSALGGFNA